MLARHTELSEAEALCWRLVESISLLGLGYRVEKGIGGLLERRSHWSQERQIFEYLVMCERIRAQAAGREGGQLKKL